MDRLIAVHVRMSCLRSRSRGLTTIEVIMLVLIAATFLFAIAYFIYNEAMKKMFERVRRLLGFDASTGR